jgi:5-hydroxyisourate hydrolase-like protein (transthyretin family)
MRVKWLWLLPGLLCAQTGSVTVQVRDLTTNTPIAGVEIKLTPATDLEATTAAQTGVDGKARFDHLPDGRFFVDSAIDGYLDSRAVGGSTSVQVKDGGAVAVNLRLSRSTILDGRVLDEDGRPMPGVTVQANFMEAQSDADGRFRIENLRGGKFRLAYRIPLELRRKALIKDEESGKLTGYPEAAFYPGVSDVAAAQSIDIAAGMDLHGVDVHLQRVALAAFTGRALLHGREPMGGVQVQLQAADPMSPKPIALEVTNADGRFGFEMIEPGEYALMVFYSERGLGLPYALPIEVGKSGVQDRQIVVPPLQTLRGMLRDKDGAAWSGQVTVTLIAKQKAGAERDTRLRGSGEFTIDGVPPGEWLLSIEGAALTRTNDKHTLTITHARFGAANPITDPITVVESGNPALEIELSTETGRIVGRMVKVRQTVVMVDRVAAVNRYVTVRAPLKEDGSFVVEDVAPGMYEVHTPTGKPVRVEVKAGETITVEVE